MTRWLIPILFLFTYLFWIPRTPVSALCRQPKDVTDQATQCKYKKTYQLNVYGQGNCKAEDASARGINGNGSYELCCEYPTEVNADDSLRAPLCGSSEELFQANNTCWSCGGTLRCAGANQSALALDATTLDLSMTNREKVGQFDTEEQLKKVWWLKSAPTGYFRFNGSDYNAGNRKIMVCTDNVGGCGATDTQCTNEKYSCYNNYGGDCGTRSKPGQCTAYSYTKLSLIPGSSSGATGTVKIGGDKACINIGDYSSHFNELSRAAETFPNGWIYILALPEWMDSISVFIKEHPSNNFMIRLHHPNAELSPDYANRWVDNLKTYAGNITNKVYLMPVNEPNNSGDRRVEPNDTKLFISALSQGLDNEGLLNTKYIITSPMIDPTSSDVTGWLGDFCADEFCDQFAAVAVAPYDVTGDMINITSYFPGASMIAAETGIKRDGQVVYGRDSETAGFLQSVKDTWGKSAIAACIFSYDPDRNTNQEWIYSAEQTKAALRSLGQSIQPITAPQIIQPKTEPSTISYQSCTEAGVPDMTTKIPIPNLVTFGQSNPVKDKDGSIFSVFSGIKEINTDRIIGKLFGFRDNKIEVPKVYERLGRQLKGALPFLTPAKIEIQSIEQELTHSGGSTYCFANDKINGKKQVFPKKATITIPAPGLNAVREAGRVLVGFMGTETVSATELKNLGSLNPNILAKINLNPFCDEPPTTYNVRKRQVTAGDQEEYDVPEEDWPVYFRSIRVPDFESILSKFLGKKCGEADCDIPREPQESHIRLKTLTPYVDKFMKDLVKDKTGKPIGALSGLQPKALQNERVIHGNTEGNSIYQEQGSSKGFIDNVTINFKNAKTMERYAEQLTNCLIHPLPLQKNLDYDCNFSDELFENIPNTSDWASSDTLGRAGPPAFTPSGPFADLLKQKAEQYGVPQCVMEGVGRIEGGGRYEELPLKECLQTTNTCSAVGPMQFTVGPGHGKATEEACKNSCGAGYCPNAWSTWGKGGNPCRYEDSLDAAARYLSAFGHFNSGDMKDSIHDAATAYYGSDDNKLARNYLNGCEYWEFVYKQCNPSYVCGNSNVGL